MEIFKSFKNKFIIITIVVILGNFLLVKPVSAKSFLAQTGGVLLEPACELLIFVRRFYNRCITN